MINVDGLRTVLGHITDHPEGWRQDVWTNCFAGQTVRLFAGATEVDTCGCGTHPDGLEADGERFFGSNIGVKAALLLGLEPPQAFKLFRASNSLEDLSRLIDEFTAEEAQRLQLAA
jgi:hypothetical protein